MVKLYLLIFSFFGILFSASTVYAGGQLVHLDADSNGYTNSDGSYGRIMRVVSRAIPCEGTEITFKFVDSKEGDYVMTPSGSATYVLTKDAPLYYQDGETVCGTTAKMASKIKGMREVTLEIKIGVNTWSTPPIIKVDFDGQYHGDNSYNGYNYRSSQDALAYLLTHPQTTPSPTSTSKPVVKNSTPTPVATPTITPSPAPDNSKVEELSQKVEDLQNQLEQSKKDQSFLEQRVNDLVDFIKKIFPFFK